MRTLVSLLLTVITFASVAVAQHISTLNCESRFASLAA